MPSIRRSSPLLLAPLAALASGAAAFSVVAEWSVLDYEWPSADAREEAIRSKAFIPEHNALAGLKVCNPAVSPRCTSEQVFVTVPRWATGVPSTLNLLVPTGGGHVLRPWPSREVQVPGNCSQIQYVQSMEIDPDGVMWVVDVGRKYFNDPSAADNSCPPKMVLIDVPTGRVLDTYVFPDVVAPYTGAFLNDIVLDVKRQVAFLSCTGNNVTDMGGIVVFDRLSKKSRRFEHPSTRAESGANITIHGVDCTEQLSGVPIDGIALEPGRRRLFYTPLGGVHVYSVDATLLGNFSVPLSVVARSVVDHGTKPSNSDGMAFGANGALFFGGLTTDALYSWQPRSSPPLPDGAQLLAKDPERLWWVDTFALDNVGNLWLTTNRLNHWSTGHMDFSGREGANFRIVRVAVGTASYMVEDQGVRVVHL